jgi:hypothetical protein
MNIKKLFLLIVISAIVATAAFANPLEFSAGWESVSAFNDGAVQVGVEFNDLIGLDLNFSTTQAMVFENPEISISGELYEDGVLVDEMSETLEMPNELSLKASGVLFGVGPYVNVMDHQGIKLQVLSQFNFHFLNAELVVENEDSGYSTSTSVSADAFAFELVPAVGIEVQPWDFPLAFTASIGYSMTWLKSINGELAASYSDTSGTEEIVYSGEVKPGTFVGQTVGFLGARVVW